MMKLLTPIVLVLAAPQAQEIDWIDFFLAGSRSLERGDLDQARRELTEVLEILPQHAPTAWQLAGVSARSGDLELALRWLESARLWGGGEAALLEWDPDLVALRGTPGFDVLLAQLRLSEVGRVLEPPEFRIAHGGNGDLSSAAPGAHFVATGAVLHDVRAGEILAIFERAGKSVHPVEISPDGRWLVSRNPAGCACPLPHSLQIHDAVTGDFVRELAPTGEMAQAQFDQGSSRLLVGERGSHSFAVWETESWTRIREITMREDQFLFSVDGSKILFLKRSGRDHAELHLWDVDEERCVAHHLDLGTVPSTNWEYSKAGDLFLIQENRTGKVRVFDGASGVPVMEFEQDEYRFSDACFLGETGELATIDESRSLRIWNARTGECLRTWSAAGIGEDWCVLEASPDGKQLIVRTSMGEVQVFSAISGQNLWSYKGSFEERASNAHYSPDGSRILIGHRDHTTTTHEASSGALLSTLGYSVLETITVAHPLRHELWIGGHDGSLIRVDALTGHALSRSRFGEVDILDLGFLGGRERLAVLDREGVLRVIDTTDGQLVAVIAGANVKGGRRHAPHLQSAHDGSALLVVDFPAAPRIYDATNWTLKYELAVEHPRTYSSAHHFSWSRDNRWIAAAAAEGRVWIFDARTGERQPIEIEIEGDVETLVFEPTRDRLWVGGNQSKVHVFDLLRGAEVHTLDLSQFAIFGGLHIGNITFDDGGDLAITTVAEAGIVSAWDPKSGEKLWHHEFHGGSPGRMHCALGRDAKVIYLWGPGSRECILSATDGSEIASLPSRIYGDVLQVADERLLCASGVDGLEVFEIESGRRRWARLDLDEDDWLATAPTLHIDGSREALAQQYMALSDGSYSLEALVAVLLDPKRVRAAAEGVRLAPALLPAIPELHWDRPQSRFVRLGDDDAVPTVVLRARCSDGIAGFEVFRNGERLHVDPEFDSGTARVLTMTLEHPSPGALIDYRWRAVSTSGVLSRALHLTVE